MLCSHALCKPLPRGKGFLNKQLYITQAYCNLLSPQTARRGFLDWQLYIIQEYCDGGTLLDAIQHKRFFDASTRAPRLTQVGAQGPPAHIGLRRKLGTAATRASLSPIPCLCLCP